MATKANQAKLKQRNTALSTKEAASDMKKRLEQSAREAAVFVLEQSKVRGEASQKMLDKAIQVGVDLRVPGRALFKDSVKGHIAGCHDLHTHWLGIFEHDMAVKRAGREDAKPDAYVRKVKSNFATVFAAVQLGDATIQHDIRNAKGERVKDAKVKVDNAQEFLSNPPEHLILTGDKFERAVKLARLIRNARGFKSSKSASDEVKPINAATMLGRLEEMGPRLTPDTILKASAWLVKQTRERILPGNAKFYDKASADYLQALAQCMTETKAAMASDAAKSSKAGTSAAIDPVEASIEATLAQAGVKTAEIISLQDNEAKRRKGRQAHQAVDKAPAIKNAKHGVQRKRKAA